MAFLASAAIVCFIVCHGGPADHFAVFADQLMKDGYTVEVYASGPALKKFQEHKIHVQHPFSLEHLSSNEEEKLAEKMAKECSAPVIITDVGHSFAKKVQTAFAKLSPRTYRLAYYDNPESYVPGGYSSIAAEVMLAAQGVLFANSNLTAEPIWQTSDCKVQFGERKRWGIGFYPMQQAIRIAGRRKKEQSTLRAQFLTKHGFQDSGQKILVYFGGNNEGVFFSSFACLSKFFISCSST